MIRIVLSTKFYTSASERAFIHFEIAVFLSCNWSGYNDACRMCAAAAVVVVVVVNMFWCTTHCDSVAILFVNLSVCYACDLYENS